MKIHGITTASGLKRKLHADFYFQELSFKIMHVNFLNRTSFGFKRSIPFRFTIKV